MKTVYVQMPDDCFLEIMHKFKTECCDCGLVHVWEFVDKGRGKKRQVGFRVKRDNRATAQRRRKRRQDD